MGLLSKLLGKKSKNEMINPMDGLNELQKAMDNGFNLMPCELYADISMVVDTPDNKPRFTYVKTDNGHITAYCVFVWADPVGSVPCFNIGYAVPEKYQHNGLAAEIIKKGIAELQNGGKRNKMSKFYIEAIIGLENHISQKLAKKFITNYSKKITDSHSGQPAYQYIDLFQS